MRVENTLSPPPAHPETVACCSPFIAVTLIHHRDQHLLPPKLITYSSPSLPVAVKTFQPTETKPISRAAYIVLHLTSIFSSPLSLYLLSFYFLGSPFPTKLIIYPLPSSLYSAKVILFSAKLIIYPFSLFGSLSRRYVLVHSPLHASSPKIILTLSSILYQVHYVYTPY